MKDKLEHLRNLISEAIEVAKSIGHSSVNELSKLFHENFEEKEKIEPLILKVSDLEIGSEIPVRIGNRIPYCKILTITPEDGAFDIEILNGESTLKITRVKIYNQDTYDFS